MAATKSGSKRSSSSKKTDATKTPAKASKKSKVEHRRPAVAPGDLAGAEYDPARTEEGDRVAATGANPPASRAGVFAHIGSSETEGGAKFDLSQFDGGSVVLSVEGKEINLTQADQINLRKLLDQGIQR